MQRKIKHCSYGFVSLLLVFVVKSINPPTLDYHFHFASEVECVNVNLSGITFNADTGNFFVISNEPEMIAEITPTGQCLSQYPLIGYEDTEDLFYIGENRMLLVQERQHTVDLVRLDSNQITHLQSLALPADSEPNKGLEGILYNTSSNSMFMVSERPKRLLKVSAWEPMKGFGPVESVVSFWSSYLLGDYSSVTDSGDSLFLLSDYSSRLLELDYDGSVKASLNLKSQASGGADLFQAEGIAIDDEESIYVVSEPNLLYVYRKNQLNGAGFLANNE